LDGVDGTELLADDKGVQLSSWKFSAEVLAGLLKDFFEGFENSSCLNLFEGYSRFLCKNISYLSGVDWGFLSSPTIDFGSNK